jgi:phage tail-like protein
MSDQSMRALTNATFRFVVDMDGQAQGAFTECTLPVIEWEVEEVKEGGLNTFTHQLPGRRKGAKITLKNGVGSSALVDWYVDAMSEKFQRKSLTVNLLDSQLKTVMTWEIADAYPTKWTGPQLKTSDNSIAIQTLELACGEVTVSKKGS